MAYSDCILIPKIQEVITLENLSNLPVYEDWEQTVGIGASLNPPLYRSKGNLKYDPHKLVQLRINSAQEFPVAASAYYEYSEDLVCKEATIDTIIINIHGGGFLGGSSWEK